MKKFLLLSLLFVAFESFAQPETLRKAHYNLEKSLAIDGYDPVAYFTNGKAKEGKRYFAYTHLGSIYHFASAENKEVFKNNPGKYEPQYGGWCAFAMGDSGEKVEVDPETFKVLDGKLYLFYNKFFNNTLNAWNKNEVQLKTRADEYWSKIAF